MIVGLVVAVCAFGALTSPALAKVKEPVELGKFKASVAGKVKGVGSAGEMKIGPYSFPEGCKKELKAKGETAAGESDTVALEVKFADCVAKRKLGGGIEEPVSVHFNIGLEFHSNGFLETGEDAGVQITHTAVKFKGKKSFCEVEIPAQDVPTTAEKKPEAEFEAVGYHTEKEKLFSKGAIKKYGEFRERLEIEWELKGIDANVQITPTCEYKNGSEEGKFNPETGKAEFGSGKMEGELEELTLKGGNLSFVPKK
jgi:hypothetical protein